MNYYEFTYHNKKNRVSERMYNTDFNDPRMICAECEYYVAAEQKRTDPHLLAWSRSECSHCQKIYKSDLLALLEESGQIKSFKRKNTVNKDRTFSSIYSLFYKYSIRQIVRDTKLSRNTVRSKRRKLMRIQEMLLHNVPHKEILENLGVSETTIKKIADNIKNNIIIE